MLLNLVRSTLYFWRGALTSKPYSFVARPWEFKSIDSIDFFDSTGSSIRFDIRGDKVFRALPRVNEDINDEWASDRARFSIDGFRVQRVDRPFLKKNRAIIGLSWSKFMFLFCKLILLLYYKPHFNSLQVLSCSYNKNSFLPFQIKSIGSFFDFESSIWLNFFQNTFFLKKFFFSSKSFSSFRTSFLLPIFFKDFFKIKNLLLISINPRFESPVLNIRLRQSVVKFGNSISSFGHSFFSNFNLLVKAGILSLIKFLNGNHWLCSFFTKNNSLILSNAVFSNFINFDSFTKINKYIGRIGVFNGYSSLINASEAGIVVDSSVNDSSKCGNNLFKLIFCTSGGNGAFINNKNDLDNNAKKNICLVSTTHGFKQLEYFDFILPNSAPFERNSTFINLEGRPQLSRVVLSPPNNVLDLKDSILIFSTLFLNVLYNKTLIFKFSSFLIKNSLNCDNNKKNLWVLVHRLFKVFNYSRSYFIKVFYSSILEYIFNKEKYILNSSDYCSNQAFSSLFSKVLSIGKSQSLLLENRNSSFRFESPDDFYTQDELSCSSPTMLIGSERFSSLYRTY